MTIRRKKAGIYFLLLVAMSAASCRQEKKIDIKDVNQYRFAANIGDSEIPYIVIDTKGEAVKDEPKIKADMYIFEKKKLIQQQNIGIEYKGKTSYRFSDKKPYSIEVWDSTSKDKKASFFGLPENEDWLLTGHIIEDSYGIPPDKTLIHNYFAYTLSNQIGKYASKCKIVELELNGEYQGIYIFMEKLKQNKNRIDVDKLLPSDTNITGGYILTIDKSSDKALEENNSWFNFNNDGGIEARYTPENSFRSKYDIHQNLITFAPYGPPFHDKKYLETYYLYEYPDKEKITKAQKSYIQSYLHDFETAFIHDDLKNGECKYQNYIDMASFVDYFILNELCGNIDAYRLSTYLQKNKNGRLAMGPIWDMDIGYNVGERIPETEWIVNYNNHVNQDAWMMVFWWPKLLLHDDFRTEVKIRWSALRKKELSDEHLMSLIDSTTTYLKKNNALKRNFEQWDKKSLSSYDANIQDLKSYLKRRASWMDAEIYKF